MSDVGTNGDSLQEAERKGSRLMSAAKNSVHPLVGGTVFLAWYHNGFTDDPPMLLEVCDAPATVLDAIREHQRGRDKTVEYGDAATWWREARSVRTANASVSIPGGEPGYAPGDC